MIDAKKTNLKMAVPFFMVTDMDRSIEFYTKGLGFELKIDWQPNGRIEWCWLEREGVALMLQEYRPENRPLEIPRQEISISFICEDALELYKEFQQNGLTPSEPFVGNNMWVTTLYDPDGYKLDFESYTVVAEDTKYSEWNSEMQLNN